MPGWESVVGLVLAGSALMLLLLIGTKYKQSRGMRLGLYCLLVASSVFRLVRGFMAGVDPAWLDALAVVVFVYAAVSEAIPLIRSRSGRGGER